LALEDLPAFGREALHKVEPSNGVLLPYYLLYVLLVVSQVDGLPHAPLLDAVDYGILQIWSRGFLTEKRL
jgi:hypothetical protein